MSFALALRQRGVELWLIVGGLKGGRGSRSAGRRPQNVKNWGRVMDQGVESRDQVACTVDVSFCLLLS